MNQNSAVDRRATRDLVNLFVVGIQKSGTTTLGSFLAEHPELLRGDAQEIHFFDDEDVDWDEPNYDHFHERFPMKTSPGAPFDVSPIYFFWPPAMPRIRSYNPDAQMVILFRDPIERGWSHWRMEAARGREHLPFSEAIREGRARLPADKPTAPEWRVASYVERGFYAQQLERALGLFPREQLLFLKTSELARDHQATLDRVCDFVGVSRFGPVPARAERRGSDEFGSIAPADTRYLRHIFEADTARFAAVAGLDLSDWPTLNPDVPVR